MNIIQRLSKTVPYYSFERLGFGFDPTTEKVKTENLISIDYSQNKEIVIENSKFKIPNCVHSTSYKSTQFHQLSYVNKTEYEEYKASSYGFNADEKLVVNTSGEGRWLKDDSSSIVQNQTVSICYEIILAKVEILDPQMHLNNPDFMAALTGLPTMLSDATSLVFLNFFEKFGTHTIIGDNIGGLVQYDATLLKSHTMNLNDSKISNKIDAVYKLIASASAQTTSGKIREKLEQQGISTVSVNFEGGSAPNHFPFDAVDEQLLSNWSTTISERPTELKRVVKLHPHYFLLADDIIFFRCRGLQEATRRYLCGELIRPESGGK